MLQWLYTYVASVCSKCFICFRRMLQKCFMLQVFHEQTREADACGMLQKCFMLQVFHEQAWKAGACGPHVRAGSRAGVGNGAARETEQRGAGIEWRGHVGVQQARASVRTCGR
jgi:hypothetical protein